MRVQLLAGWCRAVIIVIARVSFPRSFSLLFFLSGTPWSHWIARRAVNPQPRSRTCVCVDDVGVCTICWRLKSDRHYMRDIFYYVTYTEKLARAMKLMSDRHEQKRSYPMRKSFLPISGIEHNERLYWWRGIISMSVGIVCQNRNMVVHVKWERPHASSEDWNLINPTGTLLVPLILQELVEGLFAIYFHLFRLQSVSFCCTGFTLLILPSTCMFEIEWSIVIKPYAINDHNIFKLSFSWNVNNNCTW